MAGHGQTWGCKEVRRINPCSCLSIIAVCCLQHFIPVFVYFREYRWNFPARSFWPIETRLGNEFKDTSSQQVKRMLSRNCIFCSFQLVRTRANSVVWKGFMVTSLASSALLIISFREGSECMHEQPHVFFLFASLCVAVWAHTCMCASLLWTHLLPLKAF